ncbi:MAG TPA: hypothetical protein EYQ44_10885 [Porticoccaceae bacterium]|nr:hypothetical protein [Porticoccaceae bacterium]HIK81158.1 hypothetical protein [Porticoccaceae bacterium]
MSQSKFFKISEFNCSETGENAMEESFITALSQLRAACNFPFVVTSGFRSTKHSVEIIKPNGGGMHTKGIAADIKISGGSQRAKITKHALALGMSVGVAKTFVHVDTRKTEQMCWCY